MATNVLVPSAGTLTIGSPAQNVTCQVINARIQPTTNKTRIETMCGVTTVNGLVDRVLTLEFLQDWHTNGISQYLYSHAGTSVPFVWTPTADGTPSAAGTLTCEEPAFGGRAGEPATDVVNLPLVNGYILTVDA